MSTLQLQVEGTGYSVAGIGNPQIFEGKAFIREALNTTSMELSFGSLAPGEAVPFFHRHKQNEEVYVVLRGRGVFTLDGQEVPVEAGSIIRVAPAVSRCPRNTGDEPLIFLCAQAKAGSLEQAVMDDGELVP